MPNWCFTNYMFEGNKEEIKDLYDKLKSLEEMEKPLVENGFGTRWLGCVVSLFGGNWEEINCRGDFMNLELLDDNTIQLHTETAWGDMPEVWNFVLEKYESVIYYFYAEETGVCYYATNDSEGKYFPERFIVDQSEEGTEYFENETDLFAHIASVTGKSIKDQEEMKTAIELYNSKNEENDIYINEISFAS
ncbi:hypothetical protein HMPREF1214_03297 [Bacteroides sp. HPS0048]|nr:hypothetical protein HMPREF1214_03297 [Bacteroides sp. HPS0048]